MLTPCLLQGPADEEASEPEDGAEPEVEPPDDPERAARHRAQERAARARQRHEAEQRRGAPPEPCRDFRLPMHLVPQLLMVGELSQVLRDCGSSCHRPQTGQHHRRTGHLKACQLQQFRKNT